MPRTPADSTADSSSPTPAERRRGGPALNRVELIGRLAGGPQLRYTTSGIAVSTLRIVINDRDTAEFHDVVVWRQQAEFAGKYLAKGRLVFVQGRLHGRAWQMQDGTTPAQRRGDRRGPPGADPAASRRRAGRRAARSASALGLGADVPGAGRPSGLRAAH
jgi:single-strand DNA-binding protein